MTRIWETILGLDPDFLAREGEWSLTFDPLWPGETLVGDGLWNLLLVALAVGLVVWVYRRERARVSGGSGVGRATRVRPAAVLGALRLTVLLLILFLLNRPALTRTETAVEPSVLAVLIDDSRSMSVRDIGEEGEARTRLAAAVDLLNGSPALAAEVSDPAGAAPTLLAGLRTRHDVRLFRFAEGVEAIDGLDGLSAEGDVTRPVEAVRGVLDRLRGQRLAGVVLLSDGRPTAGGSAVEDGLPAETSVPVIAIPLGRDAEARNVVVRSAAGPDGAFVGDRVSLRVTIDVSGFEPGSTLPLVAIDSATGLPLPDGEGGVVRSLVTVPEHATADAATRIESELRFRPDTVGVLELVVTVEPHPDEIDVDDNSRPVRLPVIDASTHVLYVDGYPRWEYRYLKNALLRDRAVVLSTLLTSADPTFAQEGDRPITRFPETPEELADYDVLILGDVDPRQFTDRQMRLIHDWVADAGGGLLMASGPRFNPRAYRNTPLEPVLPIDFAEATTTPGGPGTSGGGESGGVGRGVNGSAGGEPFRPVVTPLGEEEGVFRFFDDPDTNATYLRQTLPPLFWYARGIAVAPGAAEPLAVHPRETGPDGSPAPLLVAGRYGAGRTLFSAIDDSWRWRYYTGESVFDTYWTRQIRLLARARKLGQRQVRFTSDRPAYAPGEPVRLELRVLDARLLDSIPPTLRPAVMRQHIDTRDVIPGGEDLTLSREAGTRDTYSGVFVPNHLGRHTATVDVPGATGDEPPRLAFDVSTPDTELASTRLDVTTLSAIVQASGGDLVMPADAPARLLSIPSAERRIPVRTSRALWDMPLVLAAFATLLAAEWAGRKLVGLI